MLLTAQVSSSTNATRAKRSVREEMNWSRPEEQGKKDFGGKRLADRLRQWSRKWEVSKERVATFLKIIENYRAYGSIRIFFFIWRWNPAIVHPFITHENDV